MKREDRIRYFKTYAPGIIGIILAYLMYLTNAFGNLGYVGVMTARNVLPDPAIGLDFFISLSWISGFLGGAAFIGVAEYFLIKLGNSRTVDNQSSPSAAAS